jgi:hypothetical protein
VFNGEYPINQVMLQENQKFAFQGNAHNKITIMDESIPWSFLENILKAQEKLSTIAKLKGKRFLFPLWGISEFYRMHKKARSRGKDFIRWRHIISYYFNRLGITDSFERHILESDRGPAYLNLAIRWNYLMSIEA